MRLNIRSIVESLTYLKSEIDSKLSGKADRSHNHDDRYYTENEANGLLDGKADAVHNHSKSQISDFAHNHDDRYYTESEIDSKLSGKAGTGTATSSNNGLMSSSDKVKLDGIATGANKTVVDNTLSNDSTNPVQNKVVSTALNGKSDKGHNHDDRYYTESEINSVVSRLEGLIDGVAGFTATEVSSLPATGENGVLYLVPKTGQGSDVHDEYVWVESTHRFELVGSTSVNLDGYYTSGQVDTLLNGKSGTGHNHDERYYTESEIDTKLSGKAGTSTATSSANGLLSKEDKAKLDGIAANANKITVDSSLSSSSTNPVQNKVVTTALNGKAGTSTATQSSNGLMSKEDKVKLDSVANEANKTITDDVLSASSTNPVQNKVVANALTSKLEILETGKINANKNDITGSISFIKARAGDTNILIISNINLRFTDTTGKDLTTAYKISDTVIPLNGFSVNTNWRMLSGLNISHALFLVETDGTVKLRMQGTLNTNMVYGEVTYMSNPPLIQ